MLSLRQDWLDHLGAMQQEMERFLEHFSSSKPPSVRFSSRAWQPAADIYETEEEVVAIIELAGVASQDLQLVVQNNVLIISGQREDKHPECRKSYCQMEVSWGPFQRALPLPCPVDGDAARAEAHEGLLEVFLPKAKENQVRKVTVKER
ncbi:MAG: Hsp20/alpha crystallin family protein [Chloroflexi bacterium]|nr:Hsp20/alpha crystallin family protein [Chloroflexota bacterium]